MRRAVAATLFAAATACHSSASKPADAGGDAAPPPIVITATVDSTRFVTREHMLAAGEMQISGEPLATAMGRDLGELQPHCICRPNIYFDTSIWSAGPWIDLPGFSTGVESYEYSKQPMNNLAFETGAGTSLAYAPARQHRRRARQRGGSLMSQPRCSSWRRLERERTLRVSGRHVPAEPELRGEQPDRLARDLADGARVRELRSDDRADQSARANSARSAPMTTPARAARVPCSDFECDATTLHLRGARDADRPDGHAGRGRLVGVEVRAVDA